MKCKKANIFISNCSALGDEDVGDASANDSVIFMGESVADAVELPPKEESKEQSGQLFSIRNQIIIVHLLALSIQLNSFLFLTSKNIQNFISVNV